MRALEVLLSAVLFLDFPDSDELLTVVEVL